MVLTKKDSIRFLRLSGISLLLLTVTIICLMSFQKVVTATGNTASHSLPTVIIDAGHGGEDGGAVASDGTVEKDINLKIAQQLQLLCQSGNLRTVMTRNKDIAIYDDDCTTLKAKKTSDMHNRLKIFNADNNAIVVSIHQNKFDKEQYHGTQVFFSPNNPESENLAESIRLSVTGLLQPDNQRQNKKANKNIFLLYRCTQPSVLVECGFLSNHEELEKLKDSDYQKQIAFAVYCGILEYISKTEQSTEQSTEFA